MSSVQEAINANIYAQKRENTRDIYACQSSQRENKEKITPKGFKAKKAIRNQPNAVALKSLFLDIDTKGEDKNSYANLSDAVTAFAAFIKAMASPGRPLWCRPASGCTSTGPCRAHSRTNGSR